MSAWHWICADLWVTRELGLHGLSDATVRSLITRHYPGGWVAFYADHSTD
jgi:hypothetical protein